MAPTKTHTMSIDAAALPFAAAAVALLMLAPCLPVSLSFVVLPSFLLLLLLFHFFESHNLNVNWGEFFWFFLGGRGNGV